MGKVDVDFNFQKIYISITLLQMHIPYLWFIEGGIQNVAINVHLDIDKTLYKQAEYCILQSWTFHLTLICYHLKQLHIILCILTLPVIRVTKVC